MGEGARYVGGGRRGTLGEAARHVGGGGAARNDDGGIAFVAREMAPRDAEAAAEHSIGLIKDCARLRMLNDHSDRRLRTGFIKAARSDWKLTVTSVITRRPAPAEAKIHQDKGAW